MPSIASRRRAALLGAAMVLGLAAPAQAAVVEWRAGPLGLAAGQAARVGIGSPDIFPCRVGVRVLATAAAVPRNGPVVVAPTEVIDTVSDPNIVPARGGLVVGYTDPNLVPGEVRHLTAQVVTDCRGVTATAVRRLAVTLEILDRATGRTQAVVQGVAP